MKLSTRQGIWLGVGGIMVTLAVVVVWQACFATTACAKIHTSPAVATSPPPAAAASLPGEVQRCAGCHMNPGMQPEYRDASGKLHQLYIDPKGYEASIHYRNDKRLCSDCHKGDYSTYPHPSGQKLPSCLDCHENIKQEYENINSMAEKSVHYTSDVVAFDCGTCHSPHTMVPAREMSVARKNAACVDCHENRYNPSGLSLAERHNWHPQAALHLNLMSCIACHTDPQGTDFSFRHRILPKEDAVSNCYSCHGPNTRMADYVGSFDHGKPQHYTRGDLVRKYYVSGATRTPLLDIGGLLFMALVITGTGTHGLLRYLSKRRRSK